MGNYLSMNQRRGLPASDGDTTQAEFLLRRDLATGLDRIETRLKALEDEMRYLASNRIEIESLKDGVDDIRDAMGIVAARISAEENRDGT
jgi:hypothetical protein